MILVVTCSQVNLSLKQILSESVFDSATALLTTDKEEVLRKNKQRSGNNKLNPQLMPQNHVVHIQIFNVQEKECCTSPSVLPMEPASIRPGHMTVDSRENDGPTAGRGNRRKPSQLHLLFFVLLPLLPSFLSCRSRKL